MLSAKISTFEPPNPSASQSDESSTSRPIVQTRPAQTPPQSMDRCSLAYAVRVIIVSPSSAHA
jgi:hypothetical protein